MNNKFATNVVLLIALIQPLNGLYVTSTENVVGVLQIIKTLANNVLGWIDPGVRATVGFYENAITHTNNFRDTGIDDSKLWNFFGHLLFFCYYNSELGSDRPIRIEFHDELSILEHWIHGLPLKLITHGWLADDSNDEGVFAIKTAYVETGGYNVITFDWSLIADCVVYPAPAVKTKPVGRALADFLDRLIRVTGSSPADVHLIGHSLGAHVVGTAGKYVESGEIGRITGLDPASPGYEVLPVVQTDHLSRDDAAFVDVIHTSSGTLGYQFGVGHVNFFPNSGKDPQPGCDYPIKSLLCSHSRSYELYTDSVYYRYSMFGIECSSWRSFENHACENNTIVPMGHDAISSSRGDFYEWTNSRRPFKTYLWEDPNNF